MTRYYYDCPIEAAYMAKNFGFDFVTEGYGSKLNFQGSSDFRIEDIHNGIYAGDKYYVAHESVALLGAKSGDLAETICQPYGSNCFDMWSEETTRIFGYYEEEVGEKLRRIIQRDGKPFIWPKKEGE